MSVTAVTGAVTPVSDVRILVIEDDAGSPTATAAVRTALEAERYVVEIAQGAADGLRRFALSPPSLVLLRTGYTDKRWVELCRHMHGLADVPIIIGFRLESWADAIPAFELGVVGYIGGPDRLQEVVARVRAALRMTAISSHLLASADASGATITQGRFVAGTLDADFAGRKVTVADQPVHLTRLEFDLLELLLSPAGQVHPRAEIINRLWSRQKLSASRTLDTHMRRLRLKLEADPNSPHRIVTVRGVGFRFDLADNPSTLHPVP